MANNTILSYQKAGDARAKSQSQKSKLKSKKLQQENSLPSVNGFRFTKRKNTWNLPDLSLKLLPINNILF